MSDTETQKTGEEPKKRGRRSVFTDEQRQILLRYYDDGMTSTKRKHMDLIEKCATECNTPVERIKRFIGAENYKRKKAAESNEVVEEASPPPTPPPPPNSRKRRSQTKAQTRQKKEKTTTDEDEDEEIQI